jgi:hypothetical protein
MLSHRLKGKWSPRRRQGFHSTPLNYSSFAGTPPRPSLWYNPSFTHILFAKGGESLKRAHISLKYLFLAIHAKGGESISPKQKDRTITNFKNVVFQLVLKEAFQLVSYFLYNFKLV